MGTTAFLPAVAATQLWVGELFDGKCFLFGFVVRVFTLGFLLCYIKYNNNKIHKNTAGEGAGDIRRATMYFIRAITSEVSDTKFWSYQCWHGQWSIGSGCGIVTPGLIITFPATLRFGKCTRCVYSCQYCTWLLLSHFGAMSQRGGKAWATQHCGSELKEIVHMQNAGGEGRFFLFVDRILVCKGWVLQFALVWSMLCLWWLQSHGATAWIRSNSLDLFGF